ncbi:BON domain-containing protein [Paraburkholderia sp. C35]|uniref:BON domain-containing protein n=1 Tax=Paraburkholderia sp. C35 TaxID=2126993 RepID=UPI000D690353|nr:BON domain-containing protein [Paraburkholderia sp. C35]
MNKANLVLAAVCSMLAFSAVSTWAQDQASDTIASATATASPPLRSREMRRANRLLAKKIRQALVKVKNLDSTNIVVSAKSGSVLLGGTVPAGDQIQLATTTAEGVSGVREVRNALRVRAPGQ